MDNEQIRTILSACRPNGADCNDPTVAEALERARLDPELGRAFAAQQEFDRGVAAALRGVCGPEEGKAVILAGQRATGVRKNRWWSLTAIAAAIAMLFGIGSQWLRHMNVMNLPIDHSYPELAAELAERHGSLAMMNRDSARLLQWLQDREAPYPSALPAGLAGLPAIGCQAWETTRGRVSMVCFTGSDGEVVHLFTFDAGLADVRLPELDDPKVEQVGDWTMAEWRQGGVVCVLSAPRRSDPGSVVEKYLRI